MKASSSLPAAPPIPGLLRVGTRLALVASALAPTWALAERVSFVHDDAGRLESMSHRVHGTVFDAHLVVDYRLDDTSGFLLGETVAYPPYESDRYPRHTYREGRDAVLDPGLVIPPGGVIRWTRGGETIPGASSPVLVIPATTPLSAVERIAATITVDGVDSVFSYVLEVEPDLVITEQPADVLFGESGFATLRLEFGGAHATSIQWHEVGVGPLPGYVESSLPLGPLGERDDGRAFFAVVRTRLQEVTTRTATLTLGNPPPTLVNSPTAQVRWPQGPGDGWTATYRGGDDGTTFAWEYSPDGETWSAVDFGEPRLDSYGDGFFYLTLAAETIPSERFGGQVRAVGIGADGTRVPSQPAGIHAVEFLRDAQVPGPDWIPEDPEQGRLGTTVWRSPPLSSLESFNLSTVTRGREGVTTFRFRWRLLGPAGSAVAWFSGAGTTLEHDGLGDWTEGEVDLDTSASRRLTWSAMLAQDHSGPEVRIEVDLLGFGEPSEPSVTVVAEGGTVVLDPEGPTYERGALVTATATPEEGREFAGWEGIDAPSLDNPVQFTVDRAVALTAHFPPAFDPILAGVEVGPISRAGSALWMLQQQELPPEGAWSLGLRNGTGTLRFIVEGPGTLRFLRHVPVDGELVVWTGDAEPIVLEGPLGWGQAVVAVGAGVREVSVVGSGAGLGWVAVADLVFLPGEAPRWTLTRSTPTGGRIEAAPDQQDYVDGTIVQLTAVPDDGWSFVGWTGDLAGTSNPASVVLSANRIVGATFAPPYSWDDLIPEGVSVATGGDHPWVPQGAVVPTGATLAARSGPIDHGAASWLDLVISGPVLLRYATRVSSEAGYDFLRVHVDGDEVLALSGESPWTQRSLALGGVQNLVRFTYAKDGSATAGLDAAFVGAFVLEPLPVLGLGSVNPFDLPFTTDPALPWSLQSTVVREGRAEAARSATIPDNESTTLAAVIDGPGTLTYWRRVSSESGYDFLSVRVGSTEVESASGEVPWGQQAATIPAGRHLVRWTYSKDRSVGSGLDAAFVDEVRFAPDTPRFEFWPIRTELASGQRGHADRHGTLALPNLLAFMMGLDPRVARPEDLPRLLGPPANGELVLAFRRATPLPAGSLVVEGSARPDGPWSPLTPLSTITSPQGTWERVEVRLAVPQQGPFHLRLAATAP